MTPPPKTATGSTREGQLATRAHVDRVVTGTFRLLDRRLDDEAGKAYAARAELRAQVDAAEKAMTDIRARVEALEAAPWNRLRRWWLGVLSAGRRAWL